MSVSISRKERSDSGNVGYMAVTRKSAVWTTQITVMLVELAKMPYDSIPFRGYARETARLEGAVQWAVAKCGGGLYPQH